jgi:hypothetical protein
VPCSKTNLHCSICTDVGSNGEGIVHLHLSPPQIMVRANARAALG